jgi:hypothetical protein
MLAFLHPVLLIRSFGVEHGELAPPPAEWSRAAGSTFHTTHTLVDAAVRRLSQQAAAAAARPPEVSTFHGILEKVEFVQSPPEPERLAVALEAQGR